MSVCHLSRYRARLNRKLTWDPATEMIIGDDQAAAMQARKRRSGYEILEV